MTTCIKRIVCLLILGGFAHSLFSQTTYTVRTKEVNGSVSPTLWGIFFEDINRAADGGVYAEMVENRSFDFPKPMTSWATWPSSRLRDGIFVVTNDGPMKPPDPKYMAVNLRAGDTVGLLNTGFDEGMGFKKGLAYTFTLRYRQVSPGVHVRAFLFSGSNAILGRAGMELTGGQGMNGGAAANGGSGQGWQEQALSMTATDSGTKGKLLVIFEGAGRLDVDRVSLFPTDTWKGRPGGLRADLVQSLAELHPGFLRFPGGCIVEGNQLVHRYQWKHTIGPLEDRELVQSIWADDVPERPTPDYMESFGLGFYEYFQLCEDIGAAPLPIINCGMSCQFDAAEVVPLNELQPFIQDALDLIEYANGDSTTVWGSKRVRSGHPAPFHLTMLGVGNENWGPQYADRLELFTKAIKAKYPYMQLINATGYSRNIPVFTYMDSVLRARHADLIDEHFYDTPKWFMENANRYDSYDRKGPSIFVGEYAAQTVRIGSMNNINNLYAALSEACFMTGMERNAAVVKMAAYAPLFAHVEGWQWKANMIWFDNLRSYMTPSYYVQQLFARNAGTSAVPLLVSGKAIEGQDSCWASAVVDQKTHELVVKLVNMSATGVTRRIVLEDARITGEATVTSLSDADPGIVNSLEQPAAVAPVTEKVAVKGKTMEVKVKPYSLTVVRVAIR